MKRKRHTEEQIIAILKEHEAGVKTADLCRKHGISEASFYNWKAKYGGLEVFADIMRLKGGNDWERILEDAIRNKAGKFLLVTTPVAVDKQGVRNEIRIASETAKKIGDKDFIVPLRLEAFDAPLGIAHAQWIDFSKGWSQGLSELLEASKPDKAILPAVTPNNADFWRGLQLKDARAIGSGPEKLISNWLSIDVLPEVIRFYDFKKRHLHWRGRKSQAERACSARAA